MPEAELEAAECRLGTPLPAALREWRLLAGRRRELWDPPDEEGFDYLALNVWTPESFFWQGQFPQDQLVSSVLHGGIGSESYWILRSHLKLDDPPVSDYQHQYTDGVTNGFSSITKMAVSLMLRRAIEAARVSRMVSRDHLCEEPDLSALVKIACNRKLLYPCRWFTPLFDVFSDSRCHEAYAEIDCLAIRARLRSHCYKPRDVLQVAFRSEEARQCFSTAMGIFGGAIESKWQ